MRPAWLAALALAMLAWSALAQAPLRGIDYQLVNAAPPAAAREAAEVIEFFWYRCPHCYAMEAPLKAWLARLPPDVRFRRVPVIFNRESAVDARLLYALQALGEFDRLHEPLLEALHGEGAAKLKGGAYKHWVAQWLASQGVDPGRYEAAASSRAVIESVDRARSLTAAFKVEGTPSFLVHGRYMITPAAGERRRMLEITGYLVSKARER